MANLNKIKWEHFQDIQIPDAETRNTFLTYVREGDYNSALAVLSSNKQKLKGKVYIADCINQITLGIKNLEIEYNNNVNLYLNDLGIKYQTLINNLGRMEIWNNSKKYNIYNSVKYNKDVYFNLKDDTPVGTLPTNTIYWLKLGLRGDKGDSFLNVSPRENWESNINYKVNDVVAYENNLYIAIKNGYNHNPKTSTGYWIVFLSALEGYIHVGTTRPNDYTNNSVWIQTNKDTDTRDKYLYGLFKRYNGNQKIWEEMYPVTLSSMIENVLPKKTTISKNFTPPSWSKNVIIVKNNHIRPYSRIKLRPERELTVDEQNFYNTMTFTKDFGQIRIECSPNVPKKAIPITIIIQ